MLRSAAMTETALTVSAEAGARLPVVTTPPSEAPTLGELFTFMSDAELRFTSLRMRIGDRTETAHGEQVETTELWLRHPGRAKVLTRPDGDAPRQDSRVWLCDSETIQTYDSAANIHSVRPVRGRPDGLTRPDLPSFARVYDPLTLLPAETLVDTFVHPHGFCRNVLATGTLTLLGTTRLRDRETWLIRCDQPRRTEVLTDRPDRSVEVGVDRLTGIIVLLIERIGDNVTRHAEVTDLSVDAPIGDDVFVLHVPDTARRLY